MHVTHLSHLLKIPHKRCYSISPIKHVIRTISRVYDIIVGFADLGQIFYISISYHNLFAYRYIYWILSDVISNVERNGKRMRVNHEVSNKNITVSNNVVGRYLFFIFIFLFLAFNCSPGEALPSNH
jgi:hypothetical protein